MAGPDDHVLERGLAQQPLALLLGAAVLGLDRQLRLLVEQRPFRVPGDDGRGEDDPAHAGGLAAGDQGAGALDVDRVDPRRVALRGDLGRQVDDALRRGGLDRTGEGFGIGEVAGDRGRARRLGASRRTRAWTSWPRPSSSAQTALPRKPLAPVTRSLTRRVYGRAACLSPKGPRAPPRSASGRRAGRTTCRSCCRRPGRRPASRRRRRGGSRRSARAARPPRSARCPGRR